MQELNGAFHSSMAPSRAPRTTAYTQGRWSNPGQTHHSCCVKYNVLPSGAQVG
jgi:hypothetical protein